MDDKEIETLDEVNDFDKKKKKRKKQLALLAPILVGIVLVLGLSYAWLKFTDEGTKKVSITIGDMKIYLDDTSGKDIQLSESDAIPTSDEKGKQGQAYEFKIVSQNINFPVKYKIYLDNDEDAISACEGCELLEDRAIRYQLVENSAAETVSTLSDSRMLTSGLIESDSTLNYSLRIWINSEAGTDNGKDIAGKSFFGKIRLEADQTPDVFGADETEASAPVLSDNMIPVKYNGYGWQKATADKTWYNYDKQVWANAVTVKPDKLDSYKSAPANSNISMDDVLQMFVWIPRYSYAIKSEDNGEHYYGKGGESAANPGEIDIKFIAAPDKDTGTAQYKSGGAADWYTPPGFTFGGKELSGIWVGKFETGSVNGTSPGDVDPATSKNLVAIKPNITSWRSIRVLTLEEISMGITEAGNIYGFDQTTYDAHAMKNTEWALISYLTQSKYGKYGNSLYAGENKQVYMNNYNGYMTGCSSGQGTASSAGSCAYRYDDLTSQGEGTGYAGAGASSTGNIYGVYDVNGGAWEYVMGNLSDPDRRSGNTQEANSGYTGKLADGTTFTGRDWKDDKYYDFYATTSTSTACTVDGNKNSPCKGHALNEVAGWYGDHANMVSAVGPWFVRGGYHATSPSSASGVFAFSSFAGQVLVGHSFRQVLTPNGN